MSGRRLGQDEGDPTELRGVTGGQAGEERRRRHPAAVAAVVVRRAAENFVADRATSLAAGISYFALLALFPLVLLAFSAFGLLLRDEELESRVFEGLVGAIPVDEPLVDETLVSLASEGAAVGIVALAGTIWTAMTLAAALRNALNVAFGVERRRPLLTGKLLDLTIVPAAGLLLLASLSLTAAWRAAQARALELGILREQPLAWDVGAAAIAALMSFTAFLFLYWALPNAPQRLRLLWPGALLAAIGFEAVKLGFAYYLARIGTLDVVYGSLGGVIALLMWVYISACIMLFGAEVSAELSRTLGEGPRRNATPDAG